MGFTERVRQVVLAGALALAGLALVAVPAPRGLVVRADSCLTGNWQSTDIETYLRSVFAASPAFSSLQVSGSQSYTFAEDGTFVNTYDGVTVQAETAAGAMTVRMFGTVSGRYQTQDGVLTTSEVSGSIDAAVALGGQPLPVATPVPGLIGDTGMPVAFSCAGDTLALTPQFPDREVAPMIFARRP